MLKQSQRPCVPNSFKGILSQLRGAVPSVLACGQRHRNHFRRPAMFFRELRRFNSTQENAPGYTEAAEKLGQPENTVKSLVHRMRRRYRALLRAEIAHTVADPAEVDEEIRYLLRVLAG